MLPEAGVVLVVRVSALCVCERGAMAHLAHLNIETMSFGSAWIICDSASGGDAR